MDVLSKDYDAKISAKKCYENVINNVVSGSIFAFHDNIKANKNRFNSLEKTIETLKEKDLILEKSPKLVLE